MEIMDVNIVFQVLLAQLTLVCVFVLSFSDIKFCFKVASKQVFFCVMFTSDFYLINQINNRQINHVSKNVSLFLV